MPTSRKSTQQIYRVSGFATICLPCLLLLGMSPAALATEIQTQPPVPTEAIPPILPRQLETQPAEQPSPLPAAPLLEPPVLTTPGGLESDPPSSDASVLGERCLPPAATAEERFVLAEIKMVGSTVLADEIARLVACYEQKSISLSDLFVLRSQITQLYIDNGFLTSGAFVERQIIDDTANIKVIEGTLESIQIEGLTRLNESYVRARLNPTTPLNQQQLQTQLQQLQLDPNILNVNAELTAGTAPGQSLLILSLVEQNALALQLNSNNFRPPSIGSTGATLSASYRNLIGIGDTLAATYNVTEGLDFYSVDLAAPFNAANGTVRLRYDNSSSRIVESAFAELGIRSNTEAVSVGIRQPIFQTPSEEFALGLDFDWRRSQSFILEDIPFSFAVGPEAGRSQVSVVRFSQDWTKRSQKRVFAARSQFNLGLDMLGATVNDTGTDGRFFSWNGQFQWVEQVSPRNLSIIKFSTQLTPDSLLPIERFSLGGIGTVRGYSQNLLTVDNAINAAAELRIPLTSDPGILQVAPFIESSYGWNSTNPSPASRVLLGTGVGLRWQATPAFFLRADYGIPLTDINSNRASLQGNGLYFSVTYQPTH